VLGVLIVAGFAVRLVLARESLFGDELSTYWIVAQHGLHGVLSLIYGTAAVKHAEITPPLYFVASWLTEHLGGTPLALRLPSLIAGTLTIPVVYLIGERTIGRRGGLLAAALTAFSPFMVYYSAEARAYGVMMLLVTGSTLSLLLALDTGRRRWWVAYAVCAGLAFWTHYTCVFVLGAQLLWVLWAHPEARRPALLASVGAGAGVLPWLPGLIDELNSPTLQILSDLSPFNAHAVWVILGHWTIGYPYAVWTLAQVPGRPALILIAAAILLTAVAHGRRLRARRAGRSPSEPRPAQRAVSALARADDRLILLVVLLLSAPVLEALVSLVSTHVFGVRNLAASWPELALVAAALIVRAGARSAVLAAAMLVVALALGVGRMVSGSYGRPDFGSAAADVQRSLRPGDVLLDETNRYLSPGPLTPLDVALSRPLPTVRALAPQERSHPFTLGDPFVSLPAATAQAIAQARAGGRVLVVGGSPDARTLAANAGTPGDRAAAGWRRVALRRYADVSVSVYARAP
jgi:hypothetical protein